MERNPPPQKKQSIRCVQFATPQNYPQSLAVLLSGLRSVPGVTFGALAVYCLSVGESGDEDAGSRTHPESERDATEPEFPAAPGAAVPVTLHAAPQPAVHALTAHAPGLQRACAWACAGIPYGFPPGGVTAADPVLPTCWCNTFRPLELPRDQHEPVTTQEKVGQAEEALDEISRDVFSR